MSALAHPRGEAPPGGFTRVLLASEGRPFSPSAIARTIELAGVAGASVHVLSIARVHGTSFGLPAPGLLPTKAEWQAQRDVVATAVSALRRQGIEADGHVLGTRKTTKRILEEAAQLGCEAIVMTADSDRNRISGDLLWSQEPQRVRRKAKLPVFLVGNE
ncbi:MAG: universal stress protein [Solirubrobacteraceae bacterium]